MVKQLAVYIALIITLPFLVGCPPTKPQPVEPPQTEPVEPPKAEHPDVTAPRVEPTEVNTPKPQPQPTISFHDKCADILRTYVDDRGMVDYRKLKQKKLVLKILLDEFAKLDPKKYNSWPKEDKIALWLNVHNIQMLKIIISNYPIQSTRIHRIFWPPTSIRHIPPTGQIGTLKWDNYKLIVMDEQFTLLEIEQRFFKKQFDEPRVFFALSHATLSGPPLRNEPYYGHKLRQQLDDQVKKFLASPYAFKIDRDKKIVHLSPIFQPTWYANEFIDKYGTDKKFKDKEPHIRAVLNFLTNYISQQDIDFLEIENYSIKYINYDWTLNE